MTDITFDNFVVTNRKSLDGWQKMYRFSNNYGASVMSNSSSYGGDKGLMELSVIRWDKNKWELDENNPVAKDSVGWLTLEDVISYLLKISNL